jgi:hypothetical protein
MRITDDDQDDSSYNKPQPSANAVLNKLKTTSTVNDAVHQTVEPSSNRVKASVESNKLSSLLSSISQNKI